MVNLLAIPPIQKSAGRTWRPWSWRTRDEMAIFRAKNMGKDGKMMKTRVDWGYTMVYPIFRQTQMCKNPSAACLLFCFVSTSDVATKRSGDARKMTFFFLQQVKLKTKKYSCSHCPELFSPKWHRLCCNNSSACAFPYHEAVASHVKVFVPQEDADDCPTEAGLKLGWAPQIPFELVTLTPTREFAIRFLMVLDDTLW